MRPYGERLAAFLKTKKKLEHAVHKELRNAVLQGWPEFELVHERWPKGPSHEKPRDLELFRWHASSNVFFFLLPCVEDEKFTLELGWSDNELFPLEEWLIFPFDDLESRMTKKRGRMRQFKDGEQFDEMWTVGSNPSFLLEVVVPVAVAKAKGFFAPVMQKILRSNHANLAK